MDKKNNLIWHSVLYNQEKLAEGRVMTVEAGHTQICLTHYKGAYHALTNICPHQGGPLGEGSIEQGLLMNGERSPMNSMQADGINGLPIW